MHISRNTGMMELWSVHILPTSIPPKPIMASSNLTTLKAPKTSYAELPLTQIKLTHHPAHAPTVTPVIVLTLYRPGKRNAFTMTMMQELEAAFRVLDED